MNIYKNAFINSLLAVCYVAFIATAINYLGKLASKFNLEEEIWGAVIMLLTFVISAAIMGAIVLGRPILWYAEGFKKEAIKLFFYTLGFMVIEVLLLFITVLATRYY